MTREKIYKIWVYEYKDDETPVGATLFEGTIGELSMNAIILPHLHPDYHYRIEVVEEFAE